LVVTLMVYSSSNQRKPKSSMRLDDEVAWNHAAGDERSIGAVVSLGLHLETVSPRKYPF